MGFLRQALAGFRLLLVLTVILGIAYPLVITLVGQVIAPAQANGSVITNSSKAVVGSSLLGQEFTGPQWFWARPSTSNYSGAVSGGSNRSPVSAAQLQARAEREAQLRAANPNADGPVPEDALTSSASGLDPHISVAYARWQLPRVAKARQLSTADLQALISAATDRAVLGFIGQDAVNITKLNAALAQR
jgi:potassium-transporting ATPase KdpC subunit